MSRPRKHDSKLPAYVRKRFGSYLYKDRKLCRVDEGEARMYEELAKRKVLSDVMLVPAAVAKFKGEFLGTLAPTSQVDYSRMLDIFAKTFTEYRVDEVTAPDIKQAIKRLFGGKDRSIVAFKSRISRFYRWCVEDEGLVKINPCREVWVKKPVGKKSAWTDELFWKMHAQLNPMLQCYHELSFLLYQRTTDVRLLQWNQVRGDAVYFQPSKTLKSSGKEVLVPITASIRDVLDRARSLATAKHRINPYIIHARDGSPYHSDGILSRYMDAERKLSPGKRLYLNPKALLPYAVTSAKRQGATLEQLKVGRAHTNISTTEGYIQTHDVPVSEVRMTLPPRTK